MIRKLRTQRDGQHWMRVAGLAVAAALVGVSGNAFAEKYASKPVRLLVPFAPGGGTDTMARLVAQKMSDALGQSVVVDNRGGGGGLIGAEMAAHATPDGYTLILLASSYASNAVLHKLTYDPIRDLHPIVMLGETAFMIAAHPSVPAKTVKELIDVAKAKPGTLNYATPGVGSSPHFAFELLKSMAGINIVHVPYKGSGIALSDLLGGRQTQMMITGLVALVPHVKAGRLRAIGVTTEKRWPTLPDIGTIGEAVPGYEASGWYGVCGPRGIPQAVADLWNREVNRMLATEEMKKRLEADALQPVGGAPDYLMNTIKRDIGKWKNVAKEAKIAVN